MEQLHAYDCHQNVTEPPATENHTHVYTSLVPRPARDTASDPRWGCLGLGTRLRVHRNCESGLAIIYKHAAHMLVQHRLQVVEMAWTDDSTLAIFFTFATSSLHRAVVCSPVTNTGTASQATNQDKPHFLKNLFNFFSIIFYAEKVHRIHEQLVLIQSVPKRLAYRII